MSPFRAPELKALSASILALAVFSGSSVRAQEDGARREVDYAAVYNTANQAFAAGRFEDAARGMTEVISQLNADPSKSTPAQIATVHYLLGAAYFNLPDYPKAIEAFRTYLQKFPTAEKALEVKLALARSLFFNKQFDEALKAFAPLELVPTLRAEALAAEAQCYAAMNRPRDQILVLEKLVPATVSTREQATGALELIGLYAQNKQAQKAIALIRSLSAHVSLVDNIVAFNSTITSFADALSAQGQYEMALSGYREVKDREEVIRFQKERLVEMDARMQANLRAAAGNTASMASAVQTNAAIRQRRNQAQELLTAFEKLPPYRAAILLREAKAWYDWGKKWEAMVVLERLLKTHPDAPEREPALFLMIAAAADVNQAPLALQFCAQYTKEFPQGANAETVGYLAGSVALQAGDPAVAESYFGSVLEKQPKSQFRETIRYQLGNAKLNRGDFPAAIAEYQRYLSEFPEGEHAAEVDYRIALAALFSGKYDDAVKGLNAWLAKHPSSQLTPDCKYRLMVCDYAAQKYPEVLKAAADWQKQYGKNDMAGEVWSLVGDSQVASGDMTGAVESYRKSAKLAQSDEVLNYSLLEAAKLLQKNGQWAQISEMFEEFVKEHPDHQMVVMAMYWVGKARAHEGKTDEAKQLLVTQLLKTINDPKRDTVEMLLDQLAQLSSKPPRPAPTAAGAPAVKPAPYDAHADLDARLAILNGGANQTGRARLIYGRAQLAKLLRNPAEYDALNFQIASQYLPEELSPVLLANAGDTLLAKGDAEKAAKFYRELKEFYPNSPYRDSADVGLAEIAFAKKDYAGALEMFTAAADLAGAKVKEATIGEAKSLVELGRYDEARKLFEQIAAMREWRGESTAEAVYALGDINARQQKWAEAIAYYQRVFVLYQRFLPWVAKAYIGAAEGFEKLGKRPEAIGHLREMLRNEKLKDFPETQRAKEMLHGWGEAA